MNRTEADPEGFQELTETEAFTVRDRGARWVRPGERNLQLGSRAAYLTRTTVDLTEIPPRAIVRATALGLYELHVNGHLVRDSGLYRPGWTDTTCRLQYQEYDVTRLLRVGTNVVGAELAPGWHGGRIGAERGSFQRLTPPELRLVVVAETSDGEPEILAATGAAWEWAASDITESDLYDGEIADRRQHAAAWTAPDAADLGRWEPMEPSCGTSGRLVAQAGPTVRETSTWPVTEVRWLADGTAVVDTGRNENGFVRVVVAVEPGTRVTVSYGELASADGHVYQENLRSARCRDVFTCAGTKPEELAPRFTFRSFRYAQISGLPAPSALISTERAVVGTDLERVGWFECSDPLLNEIYQAILTSQRANFVEVPTDCPQRDERLGWMADALLFAPLAAYNYDISGMMSKWFDDILDARTSRGLFTDVAPRPPRAMLDDREGAPAWADAGVLIPWLIYQRYGDREVLERMFPAMIGWLRAVHADNPDGIWRHGRGNDYGDWVPAGPDTSHDLFATCWLFRSTRVAAKIAQILGRDEAAWLLQRAETVRNAFLGAFLDTDTGRIVAPEPEDSRAARRFAPQVAQETQTGYILPLVFGMLDDQASARCARRLAEMVRDSGHRLETGFTGSAFILDALADGGHTGLAYELLQRSEFPSLGYMISRGATSVWERWDGLQPGGGPASPTMNSFNHYALGSMFRWAIEAVCGLRMAADAVAFQTFRFAPSVAGTLRWASFRFASPQGQIQVRWDRAPEDAVTGEVAVPPGTMCLVAREVPDGDRVLSLVTGDLPPVPADPGAPADEGWPLGPGTHRVRWQA
jgi:alpha-L-rhamnosidase